MWLLLLLLLVDQPDAERILLDRLECAAGRVNHTFLYQTCYRYPDVKLFPFCVYMVIPSTETKQGYDVYGCVYAHLLPQECIDKREYYTSYAKITVNRTEHAGAMMCCMDDNCNELEEPVFAQVRLMDDSESVLKESWPVLVCIFVVITGAIPLLMSSLTERYRKSQRHAEQALPLEPEKEIVDLKFVPNHVSVKPQFSNIKRMQDTLMHFKNPHRYPVVGQDDDISIFQCILFCSFWGDTLEEADVGFVPEVQLVQQDNTVARKVLRTIQSKHSSLALRMVEHGPFEFDFDPVELGDLFDGVSTMLGREPTLIELSGDTYIYGNLQGSYDDLFRWMNLNGWPPKRKILFMGGLTADDQPYSLETIALVFALKKQLPNHIYILRGAAEVYAMNIKDRFSRCVSRCLEDAILRACGYLPLAALVSDTILVCHGGLSLKLTKLDQIRDIRRPIHHVKRGTLAADLIFSQVYTKNEVITGARGYRFAPTSEMFQDILTKMGIEVLIRSRNPVEKGYQLHGYRVISLWSHPMRGTPRKGGEVVGGASIHISTQKLIKFAKLAVFGTFTKQELNAKLKELEAETKKRTLQQQQQRKSKDRKSREDAKKKSA